MIRPTESERGVVGLCVTWGELAREVVDAVLPEMILDETARKTLAVVSALLSQGSVVDVATVTQAAGADGSLGAGKVSELALDSVPKEHLSHHLAVVRSAHFARQIVAGARKLAEDPENADVLAAIQRLAVAREGEKADTFFDFSKDLPAYMDTLERPRAEDAPMSTGFARLDSILTGLKRRDLFTVSARPGGGKTAFVTGLSFNMAAAGRKVLMYSTEMDRYQVVNRVMPSRSGVEAWKFRKQVLNDAERGRVADAAAEMHGRTRVVVDDRPRPTLLDIRRGIAKVSPDVVVIDYLQRCRKPKAENVTRSNDEFLVEVKSIAKETGVLIVLLCQMNRAVDRSGRPMMSDLRDTGSIEAESDQVMLLHTPDREESYRGDIRMTAYVDKNRHGRLGKTFFVIDRDYANIKEVEDGGVEADGGGGAPAAQGGSLWPKRAGARRGGTGGAQGAAAGQGAGDGPGDRISAGGDEVPF